MENPVEDINEIGSLLVTKWKQIIVDGEKAVKSLDRVLLLTQFKAVLEILPFMMRNGIQKVDPEGIRVRALHVMKAIAHEFRDSGHYLMPMALEAQGYCLMGLRTVSDDLKLHTSIYKFLKALFPILELKMASAFPEIMSNAVMGVQAEQPESDASALKTSILRLLKMFSEEATKAFEKHVQNTLHLAVGLIHHPDEPVRSKAVDCVCNALVAMHSLDHGQQMHELFRILMMQLTPKLRTEKNCFFVIDIMTYLGKVFSSVGPISVPTQEVRDMVFEVIRDLFNQRVDCQNAGGEPYLEMDNGAEDAIMDEGEDISVLSIPMDPLLYLHFQAFHLFAEFGYALKVELFQFYFEQLLPNIQKLQTMIDDDEGSFYALLGLCVKRLEIHVAPFFDCLSHMYLLGFREASTFHRHNALFGIGELITYSGERAVAAYPQIFTALRNHLDEETEAGPKDNAVGALARMIITNPDVIPLTEVMPVLLKNLPLTEDFEENLILLNAFILIYKKYPASIGDYLESILTFTLLALSRNEIFDPNDKQLWVDFALLIKDHYPDMFIRVTGSLPEAQDFLRSLHYISW